MTTDTAPQAQDAHQVAIKALELAMNRLASNRSAAHYYGDGDLWDLYESAASGLRALAAAPAAAPRQPLTREQIKDLYGDNNNWDLTWPYVTAFARSIEQWHGIGGAPAPATGEQT